MLDLNVELDLELILNFKLDRTSLKPQEVPQLVISYPTCNSSNF